MALPQARDSAKQLHSLQEQMTAIREDFMLSIRLVLGRNLPWYQILPTASRGLLGLKKWTFVILSKMRMMPAAAVMTKFT